MSVIQFTCESCNAKLQVKTELAGKKIKCPKCGTVSTINAGSPTPPPAESDAPTPNSPLKNASSYAA